MLCATSCKCSKCLDCAATSEKEQEEARHFWSQWSMIDQCLSVNLRVWNSGLGSSSKSQVERQHEESETGEEDGRRLLLAPGVCVSASAIGQLKLRITALLKALGSALLTAPTPDSPARSLTEAEETGPAAAPLQSRKPYKEALSASKAAEDLEDHTRAPSTGTIQLYPSSTSIPLSVHEIESETDVGAPSPSPQIRGALWGSFSPPDDIDIICPTPYQSQCVDHAAPETPELGHWGAPCKLSGRQHLDCFGEAVVRALQCEKDPTDVLGGPSHCPHLDEAAKERQRAMPPSLLALDELIRDRMGCRPVPGLHANTPSCSPRSCNAARAPTGPPLHTLVDREGQPTEYPVTLPWISEKLAALEKPLLQSSTRDASVETSRAFEPPGEPPDAENSSSQSNSGSNRSSGSAMYKDESESWTSPYVSAKHAEEMNLRSEGEVDRVCCDAHSMSIQGARGSSSYSSIAGSLQALKQLSPRLHECSEAITRTVLQRRRLLQGPLERPSGGPKSASEGGSDPLYGDALEDICLTLKRLQLSIDHFTSVLSHCEGRFLSESLGIPLGESSREASPEATGYGEAAEESSRAPSSIDTTRAQMGSPSGPKGGVDEGSLSPVFYIKKATTSAYSGLRCGELPRDPVLGPCGQYAVGSCHGSSNESLAGACSARLVNVASKGTPMAAGLRGPCQNVSQETHGSGVGGIYEGPSEVLCMGRSANARKGLWVPGCDATSVCAEKRRVEKVKGGVRALRWARERLKSLVPSQKKTDSTE
ncbi:uncharacterized protein LOC113147482 [Cyclospora cayetanensis]|uniref:Uncharacterized protein LOC113147482 n=1 Tax=Cyclospora cayetanensis TaxID=88456 RepID=A0A6P6S1D9_9EIME|nr:uncharacterized protein LOC113147482 [Cyclospora cayetanensis]